jgi:uncharacterized protein
MAPSDGRVLSRAGRRVGLLAVLGLALLLAADHGWAQSDFQPIPALAGPVVDRVGVLSGAAEQSIRSLALELEEKTGAEIAVLIVPTTAPEDVFDYGMRVVEQWKLGKQGRDDGLLLLIATDDRRLQFLTGYGLEAILPDGRLGAIRDGYLVPAFRAGDFDTGISQAMRAVADVIAADAGVVLSGDPARPPPRSREGGDRRFDPLLFLLILFFILLPMLRGGRRGRRGFAPIFFGGGLGGGFGGRGGGGGAWGGAWGGVWGGGGGFGGGGAGGGW